MLKHRAMDSNTQFGDKKEFSMARKSLDEAIKQIEHAETEFWLHAIAQMFDFDHTKRPSAKELFVMVVHIFVEAERESSLCENCERVARSWGLIDHLGTDLAPPSARAL